MKFNRRFVYRIMLYMLGVLFLAFSGAFAINSNLGTSPVNSLPYCISLVSGASLGNCVIYVFSFYVLLQIVLLRKRFIWYNIFQLAFALLYGYLADLARRALGDFCFPTYFGRLGMLLIAILFLSIGISLYVNARLVPMPPEGLTFALAQVFRVRFHRIKTIQDCALVLLSVCISLLFLRRLIGVREGTVLSALLSGRLIGFMQAWIRPLTERLCFPAETDAHASANAQP